MRVIPGPRVIDDAYIIFRYAQNLIAGNGLVYNPGEPVFGMTTPLFVLLLSGLAFPVGGAAAPFASLALGVSAVADAGTCWLLIRLARSLERPGAGIMAALVWAVAPMSVTFAVGGMETSVFIFLMTATLYFHSIRRPAAAAFTAALSLLTRPDALLFIVCIGLERARQIWVNRRRNGNYPPLTLREGIAFALPVLVWGGFATVAYGSPVPHSVTAKVAAYHLPAEAALVRLLQHFGTPFFEERVFGTAWIGVGLVLYAVLYLLGAVDSVRRRAETWPLFAFPPLYALAFSIANPLIFRWYLAPPLPMFFFGIFLGAVRIALDVGRPRAAWAMGALGVLLSLNAWTLHPNSGSARPAPEMAFVGLEEIYTQVGRQLRGVIKPGQTVASGDIGALGFFSGARILDLVGLVSPRVVRYYPLPDDAYVINFAIPAAAVDELGPDYLVMLEVYGRETLLKDPAFLHQYVLENRIPTDLYGSRGMLVFRRVAP
jgi:arabinofuranosyltransferase